MKTVSNVASPDKMLKIVNTTKAVEAMRNTKEKRYIRGMTAQPYNISNKNKSPIRGPARKEKSLNTHDILRVSDWKDFEMLPSLKTAIPFP